MEAADASEMLVAFYYATRCYNPEDHNPSLHRNKNLKY
jgi:hypothetical protein